MMSCWLKVLQNFAVPAGRPNEIPGDFLYQRHSPIFPWETVVCTAEKEISHFINYLNSGEDILAKHEEIARMLFSVIDELNQLRPAAERLEKNLDSPLAGDAGILDSAGLINLIVLAEQKTAEELGTPILLTDDRTMSQVKEVFGTLGSLADYIQQLLDERSDG
jgi:acyl carrier protein